MVRLATVWLLLCSLSFADDWVIGLDADMSSVAKQGGLAIQQGIELAIEEINEAGGVLGKPVRLMVRDHRGNPARGIANLKAFNKLENLLAVVGGVHTPVAIAQLPIVHEAPLVYLSPWAAGTPVVSNGFEPNFVFRLSVRDEWAGGVILAQAKADNCPNVTLLLERTGWGRSNEASMTQASETLSLPINSIEWFNWNSEILGPLVEKLAQDKVECVVLVSNTPEGVEIIRAIAALPALKRPKVYSHWGITGGNFIDQLGLQDLGAVSLKYLQTIAFNRPKTKRGEQLKARFKEKYGQVDGHNAFSGVAHGYDLTHLLALAVSKAGEQTPDAIRQALENLDTFEGVMKTYQRPFSADNHEALSQEDYVMLQFNAQGFGVLK